RALLEQLEAPLAHLGVFLVGHELETVAQGPDRAQQVVAQARAEQGGKIRRGSHWRALAVLHDIGKRREARLLVAPERYAALGDDGPDLAVAGRHRPIDVRGAGRARRMRVII